MRWQKLANIGFLASCFPIPANVKAAFAFLGALLFSGIRIFFKNLTQKGVDESTPLPLIERIVFSNHIFLISTPIYIFFGIVNYLQGYYLLLALIFLYQIATLVAFYLSIHGRPLLSRVLLLCTVYIGLFVTGLIQGPVVEIEHFFIPFGALAFIIFYSDERKFSFLFLAVAMVCFAFLVGQTGPLWDVDPAAGRYTSSDLWSNRFGYLVIFAVCLYALSRSFERALKIIDDQRSRLYEERRLATFGSVVGNVAHEINSPLMAMDAQLFQLDAVLKKGDRSIPEAQSRVDHIRKISKRISVIVRGLKFISGEDSGDSMIRHPIGMIIDSALDLTRDRMEKEGVRFELRIENSMKEVLCRPIALSQVFLNLISNALDALEDLPAESRWILMESQKQGEHLIVSIADGGSISSQEARDSLFRSFYTTKPAGRGSGLGLSISRETVEAHGGTLELDSQSTNTKFVMALPLKN